MDHRQLDDCAPGTESTRLKGRQWGWRKRLIACGFPATGAEACYRNPASEMKSFIEKYHADHMMVYNLCMESDRVYSPSILGLSPERVERHGTYDHNPPPLPYTPTCRQVSQVPVLLWMPTSRTFAFKWRDQKVAVGDQACVLSRENLCSSAGTNM